MINVIQYRYKNDVINIPISKEGKLDVNNIKVYTGIAKEKQFETDEIRFSQESVLADNEHKFVSQIDEVFHVHISGKDGYKKKVIGKIPVEDLVMIIDKFWEDEELWKESGVSK
jgi:hypothetical protein